MSPKPHDGNEVNLQEASSFHIPQGARLVPDDRKGIVTVEGPRDFVSEVLRILPEYDVPLKMVSLHLGMVSKLDHFATSADLQLANNHRITHSDDLTDLRIDVGARVNGDKTVTLSVDLGVDKLADAFVIRVKVGETIRIGFGPNVALLEGPPEVIRYSAFRNTPSKFRGLSTGPLNKCDFVFSFRVDGIKQ
jgi:hypothetical protein